MTFQRFEDLEIWQNARSICSKIRGLVNNSTLGKDFSIKDQILRSSGSCMDNIAEGFERDGNKEFINFLIISKGSIGETRSQVYRAFDAGHFNEETFNEILNDCFAISKKISGFISFLKKSALNGRFRTNQENS
jgi:four helix bundle protein